MTEKIALFADSCADIPKDICEKYDIFIIPLLVINGTTEYKDGVTITAEDVYEMQKESVLHTASPKGEDVLKVLEDMKAKGYTHAIGFALSSALSSTFQSIRLTAMGDDELTAEVFDSKNGSIGYGGLLTILAKYRDEGMSYNDLLKKAEKLITDSHPFFSIDTLEYLEKGGRIGKVAAFAGNLLGIKPIISFDTSTGEFYVPAKARRAKAVPSTLLAQVEKVLNDNPGRAYYLITAHGGSPDEFVKLKAELIERFPDAKGCIEATIGATLSAYIGKGMLGAGVIFDD